ncbi:MAG: ribonuclease J, partial [Candidatus Parcubacteria bacterium]|nr:ribonuclease J [Candidatus Parcubacteria bacterium]
KTIQIQDTKQKINLNDFNLSFFEVEHSIMDSMGIVLATPSATVIHMGDWTLGTDSSSKKTISYNNLSQLAKPTILMIESLGATNRGVLATEEDMWKNLRQIITESPGRVIIATFATQVKRARDIITFAQKLGKKVAIDGYSMKMNIKVAQQLGYIKGANNTLIDIKKINDYPDNKIVILGTGAQGEARAVLSRIVTGNHRYVKLRKNDTVIFSSSIIPGNERTIQRLKDNLYRQCDNVIHNEIMNIHVSGHNNVEAIQEVVKQIRPTYVLPVYANHYLLKEAEKVIKEINFPPKNILILDNGHIAKFNKQKLPVIEKKKVDTGYVFIDGLGSQDLEAVVLRDRRALSSDGIFVIIAVVNNQTGKVVSSPDIISRGFVFLDTSKNLLYQSRKKAVSIIEESTGSGQSVNWPYIKNNLRDKIGDFLYQKTGKRPMILPVVIEV